MKHLIFVTIFISSAAIAEQNQLALCQFGDNQRKIEVVYPQDSNNVCEVQYTKNSEMRVLWSARSDRGYCAEKAASFVEKHQGWGWRCEAQNEDEIEAPAKSTTSKDTNKELEGEEIDATANSNSVKT